MEPTAGELQAAYAYCSDLARRHYENFPVASYLLPKKIRQAVAVIYSFARTADDIADEGEHEPQQRIALLNDYRARLESCTEIPSEDPIFIALSDVIQRFELPLQPLHDLLTAFSMDVSKSRYATSADLLNYCRHSADPIGRLLLLLQDVDTPSNRQLADAICTSLQLINFWQDIAEDANERDRIYMPQDLMQQFGVDAADIVSTANHPALWSLVETLLEDARERLLAGAQLAHEVGGRFGWQLRATVMGGLRIIELKLRRKEPLYRPTLTLGDWIVIFSQSIFSYPRPTKPGLGTI